MKKFDINSTRRGKACDDAQEWYKYQPDFKTAWEKCNRPDWMMWMADGLMDKENCLYDLRLITLCKALQAKTIIHLLESEPRINAIEMAEKFGRGSGNKKNLTSINLYYGPIHGHIYFANKAVCTVINHNDLFTCHDTASAAAAYSAYGFNNDVKKQVFKSAFLQNERQTANLCREVLTDRVFEIINTHYIKT